MKKFTFLLSAMLFSVMSFAATVTFSPSDFETVTEAAIKIEAGGVTLSIGKGTITADEFRFFKSQTLTVSSTAGNITSIEFTCTAANKTKYGPGGFGALDGYTYADKVGTWTGSTASVTFSTTNNQVRATQVVVTIDGEGGNTTPDDGGDDVTPDDGGNTTPDDGGDDTPDDGGNTTPDNGDDDTNVTVGSLDGYSKVTKTSSLANGDKVVLYCDEAKLGVTGWNGNKDATVATEGWVAYVVEVVDGGFYLKDGDQYITGAESANHFKYGEKAVCGVSDAGVLACGTKFLYKNGDYYRMYTDKSSNSAYKPFYVYKAGAGSGETPDTPDTPKGDEVKVSGLVYADAYYYEYEGASYYDIDMYKDMDSETYEYTYPEVYVSIPAKSKTALNGTYDVLYAGYWSSANDSVEIDEETYGTITIKNTDNEGNYSVQGSFVGTDGKTYTFNEVVNVWAFDYDNSEEIVLSENGETPDTDDMLTCAEAATIAAAENYQGTEEVTVYGYVVELGQQKVDDKTSRNKQCFYLSDNKDGEKQFMAYWAFVPDFFEVGDKVAVTGILKNYKGTIEIVDGEATLLGGTAVEDVLVGETPVKMIKNGQLMIIRGENTYNVLGAQMK